MSQKERLQEAKGAGPVRVLPFGIVMRDLEERGAAMDVRLSPVELANLHLINDPALGERSVPRPAEGASAKRQHGHSSERREDPGSSHLDHPALLGRQEADVIQVGPEIERVGQGQEGPRAHKRVEVHPDNPFFMSDGQALYTKDSKELVRLVVSVDAYEVIPGCERIGERAFDSASSLERVTLPCSLRSIGRLAFAKTDIAWLDVPQGVEAIEEKVCFSCRKLKACILPETLQRIGASAFAHSGVERVRIPAKV